jgi:hypothetical protein
MKIAMGIALPALQCLVRCAGIVFAASMPSNPGKLEDRFVDPHRRSVPA